MAINDDYFNLVLCFLFSGKPILLSISQSIMIMLLFLYFEMDSCHNSFRLFLDINNLFGLISLISLGFINLLLC